MYALARRAQRAPLPAAQVTDPSTGRGIARVANCKAAETTAAIAAASAAFPAWSNRTAKERAAVLKRRACAPRGRHAGAEASVAAPLQVARADAGGGGRHLHAHDL